MKDGRFSATSSTAIFDDCRILATRFREITFVHCNWEANEIAHVLARHSFNDHINCFWEDDPSSFLFVKRINDVTVFENQ